jgi:hypothetical protein
MLLLETTDMLHTEVKMNNVHDFGIRISNLSMKQWGGVYFFLISDEYYESILWKGISSISTMKNTSKFDIIGIEFQKSFFRNFRCCFLKLQICCTLKWKWITFTILGSEYQIYQWNSGNTTARIHFCTFYNHESLFEATSKVSQISLKTVISQRHLEIDSGERRFRYVYLYTSVPLEWIYFFNSRID